jgi:hypothetical protein
MKIICIRIGNKYGQLYEEYLKEKLPEHEFIWIKEPYDPRVLLQWNKMYGMNLDIDEPICVIDIDILLVNDYKKIFDYPIKKGQFLAMPGWWRDNSEYKINGGFFKYYPKDCKYIYDKFMSDIDYWQNYYIKNGTTRGPVNGEQYFVEDSVKEKLELITIPDSWVTRWCSTSDVIGGKDLKKWHFETTLKYKELTNNEYVYLGGEFHNDIKLVHFTNSINKPHEWPDYKLFNKDVNNVFYVSDYKNSENSLLNDLYKSEAFKGTIREDNLKDFTFYEFTLEELGFPSAQKILDGVKKIENEIGLQGWMVGGVEKKKGYNGFSLTYNPDYFDKSVSKYHQTWGHKLMKQTFSGWIDIGEHKNMKNTYYDTYGFRNIHELIYNNLKEVIDNLNMPLLRSRCAYLWPNPEKLDPFKDNWHIDEYPFDMLRVNIPLQTSVEHELHIKGEDRFGNSYNIEKHLEVGKAYLWNTNIPHTVGCKTGAPLDLPRIHLVLGMSTYFDYNKKKDCFVKSKNWGKPLKELVLSKSFVKNA